MSDTNLRAFYSRSAGLFVAVKTGKHEYATSGIMHVEGTKYAHFTPTNGDRRGSAGSGKCGGVFWTKDPEMIAGLEEMLDKNSDKYDSNLMTEREWLEWSTPAEIRAATAEATNNDLRRQIETQNRLLEKLRGQGKVA